jgi:hypothetical protein
MTLQDAIIQVLIQQKRPMTATAIAAALNKNKWYIKKDGSDIKGNQIHARVKSYPHLFAKVNDLILRNTSGITPLKKSKIIPTREIETVQEDITLLTEMLLNEKNFKPLPSCEHQIPALAGLYCIRILDPYAFNKPYCDILKERKHNLIYIGIASKSLRKRFLNQELRAKGHGTFFRTIGAVLGYLPETGSLAGKRNQNNYKFSKQVENKIIEWMDKNLLINWVTMEAGCNKIESELIKVHLPLLNIAVNPGALKELTVLRNECKRVATQIL